ncbi:hypothetical protein K445DRAFT_149016 [Daldinia sp. EC12]|nr:hypothetical protein K445DRAFT_149016 [Daldinia sp. EC12]
MRNFLVRNLKGLALPVSVWCSSSCPPTGPQLWPHHIPRLTIYGLRITHIHGAHCTVQSVVKLGRASRCSTYYIVVIESFRNMAHEAPEFRGPSFSVLLRHYLGCSLFLY